jgi:Protein of unknown function (DUF1549)/Protein of unknown function (DUF1553)
MRPFTVRGCLLFSLLATVPSATAPAARLPQKARAVTQAAAVLRLRVTPDHLTLDGPLARHGLLVSAVRADGTEQDVTTHAALSSTTPAVARIEPPAAGSTRPSRVAAAGNGRGTVVVSYGGQQARVAVEVTGMERTVVYSFANDVIPTLARLGCSQGSCHGAQQGKGGFKLSLRGYAPDLDYLAITRQEAGRRITPAEPERSLLLRKPLGEIPHGGGRRLAKGAPDYHVLLGWLRAGAPPPDASEAHLTRLEVLPGDRLMAPREQQHLLLRATFSDGHSADVTPRALFKSNDDATATVTDDGLVTAAMPGETAIMARYMDQVVVCRVTIPYPFRVPETRPRVNVVDDCVFRHLQRLRLEPSPLCSDSDFLRRAYLDAIGTLPTAAEARAFLDDRAPDKRANLVGTLLQRPEFAELWALKLADLLLLRKEYMTRKNTLALQQWLADQLRRPHPNWARLVTQLLTASGSLDEHPETLFYVSRQQMRPGEKFWIRSPELTAEITAQVFLGARIHCARCHNHPSERYTQDDYYRFVAMFAQVTGEGDGDLPRKVVATSDYEVRQPRTGEVMPPAPLDRSPFPLAKGEDRRVKLAAWLTRPQNEAFAANIVNRLWARCFGSGIVEPVDDLRSTNPPKDEPLLRALARDLVEHDYDLKHVLATIMNSRTYQASAEAQPANKLDTQFFSHYTPRRLQAEELLDAVAQVTGVPERFNGYALGTRAVEITDSEIPSLWLDLFGRPPRVMPCDCERTTTASVSQALALLNGEELQAKIQSPDGVLPGLLQSGRTDDVLVEELFLAAFARRPTAAERQAAATAITHSPSRAEGFQDLLWALLNSKEFMFNH